MKEADRRRAIHARLARSETRDPLPLPTGFPALDAAIGGGLPRGNIVEIFGAPSIGKSTLALGMAASVQRAGGAAAWIDAEHAFDAALAEHAGVQLERLPVVQPDSAEQALEIARQLAGSGAVDLVVVDSAAALVPQVELETAIGHSGHSLQTRVLATGLRRLSGDLRRTGTVLLFLNQTRGGDDFETSAGGPALKLFAALRIGLRTASDRRVRFRVLKNKAGEPFREGVLSWEDSTCGGETP